MNVRTLIPGPAIALALLAAPLAALAESADGSFLTDYSKLKAAPENAFEKIYVAPDAQAQAAKYKSIMIDQPEVFVHPDSKYQGMKPDDMKQIADGLREAVAAQLKDRYTIVDAPGPDVLYVRLAVTDVMLQKKKRPILAYTPVGAVVKAAKDAMTTAASKVDLKNMKIEGEVLDSTTQAQLGAMSASRGSLSPAGSATEQVSWKELNDLFTLTGKRLRCRMDNVARPVADWEKCGGIGIAAN